MATPNLVLMPPHQNMANAVNDQTQMQQNLVNGVNAGNDHNDKNQLQQNVMDHINVVNDQNEIQQNEVKEVNVGNDHNDKLNQNLVNGGDVFALEQLQPSALGAAAPDAAEDQEEEAAPTVEEVCRKGIALGRLLLFRVAKRLAAAPLSQRAYDIVNRTLAVAEQATESAQAAVSENQSLLWYITTPLSVLQMAVKTGVELAERFLDRRVPENLRLVNYLEQLKGQIEKRQERVATISVPSDVKQPGSPDLRPVLNDSSSESSLSDHQEHLSSSFEESTVPENPGEKTLYFSVDLTEQPKEQEDEGTEGGVENDENKREFEKEEAQGGKGEEQQLPAAAGVEPVEAPAALGGPLSAGEAERAAQGAGEQPLASAQAASSEDLLAAEASSRPEAGPSMRAGRPSRATKGLLFLNLFGAKSG